GMHLELRSQLAERLLAADRLDHHPSFELRAMLFSRRRHRPLLVNDSAENLSLLLGLKSWDHYKAHPSQTSCPRRWSWSSGESMPPVARAWWCPTMFSTDNGGCEVPSGSVHEPAVSGVSG